jgi:predicted metal-dependent enzyme (double-stranded beta helix superfamily)
MATVRAPHARPHHLEPDVPLVHPALLDLSGGWSDLAGPSELAGHLGDELMCDEGDPLDLATLTALVRRLAATRRLWRPIIRHDADKRWYTRLLLTGVVEVWLIGWAPGQHTEVHDHGGALGALAVADGTVEEDLHVADGGSWQARGTRRHAQGSVAGFTADHAHRVINRSELPATTVHAYSPPEVPLRYAARDGAITVPSSTVSSSALLTAPGVPAGRRSLTAAIGR